MARIIINGPEGLLEAQYNHTKEENAPIALILHPHPEYGGTMDNKVTFALYKAFTEMGYNTLRFNFRGVGNSQGRFDEGEGGLTDAASVMDWLQAYNPNASNCWVAGFSYGAWVSMQLLMRRPEIDGFISVSPPANMYDFSFLAPCPVSGQILQGTKDEIVSKDSVDMLVNKLNQQKNISIDYKLVEGGDHFFTNQLDTVMGTVKKYVTQVHVERPQIIRGRSGSRR